MKRNRMLAVCMVAVFTLGACGDGNGVATELEGLDGAQITIGSKEFSEQIILGQMLVQALEAAGAQVTDRTNLAGTLVLRESLAAGEIDLYWEYTGTGWADIFGEEEVIDDPDELLATVAERDLEENGVVWGERAEFENTYAIASNQAILEEYGVETLSDLAELSQTSQDDATVCIAEEFATRADGFIGMQEHYDMNIPEEQQLMDEGIIYTETADAPDSSCNFGMVFTTDGRIGALDLVVLEDDQAFFPEYNPAITVRSEIAEEYPEVVDLANDIIGRIDFETMRELNLRADEEGVPHEDVARDFLVDEGIISG
jgi:osmoprotectant transport system substrate-binding protein